MPRQPITADSLMTLEAYARNRPTLQPGLIAHRRLRSVALGPHLMLQFEDERTVRYQIQEMLRLERTFEPDGIQHEIDAYAPLVPEGGNWKATLLIAYPDAGERREALGRLVGVEQQLYVAVQEAPGGEPRRVWGIADEDLDRATAHKTSAVHFLRFELDGALRAAIRAGAPVQVGCDHPHARQAVGLDGPTLASLVADLDA